MNDLLHLQATLTEALTYDMQTALALMCVWLDPLWIGAHDLDLIESEYDDPLYNALVVSRRCFPQVYVEAVEALHQNQTANQIEYIITTGIERAGIPVEHLETLCWGIPVPAYGIYLDDPEFHTDHPDTLPILECFGFDSETLNMPSHAYDIAYVIETSLQAQERESCTHAAVLLSWVFSTSANTVIGHTYEEILEYEPLQWIPDDVEFAIYMISEANDLLSQAMTAIQYLNDAPAARKQLHQNIQFVQAKGKITDVNAFVERHQLDWSAFA